MRQPLPPLLHPIVDRFESAWEKAPPIPAIDDFLTDVPPEQRLLLLRELVLVDLERRLGSGETVILEERYLKPFPDLPADADWMASLVVRDRELRQRFNGTRIDPRPGTRLDTYELIEEIGSGGMGVVFRARHLVLQKPVALKVLSSRLPWSPELAARFHREVAAAGRLEHPNLVRAFDAGQAGNVHFLVMEWLDGVDLQRLLWRRGPWPIADACEAVRQAATGLQHAHEQGLVHRDVKPSNLMMTRDGVVKVLDLGLARLREQPAVDLLTRPGEAMGTPDFMSPEQWQDSHAADVRSDLYSLGCTLFALLTGEPPFAGPAYATHERKRRAHVAETPPELRRRRADVPAELTEMVGRLLAKNPADRFASPAEVASALAPFAVGSRLPQLLEAKPNGGTPPSPSLVPTMGGQSAPTPSLMPSPPLSSRSRWLWAVGGLVALAVLAAVAFGWWWSVQPTHIDSLTVVYYRPRADAPPVEAGIIGVGGTRLPVGYSVRVTTKLSRPGYIYLIALNPDGTDHLCTPEGDGSRGRLDFVPTPGHDTIRLERAGLQAFVIIASRQPLPPYEEWKAKHGAPPWRPSASETAWSYRDCRLVPLGERGEVEQSPVEELEAYLKSLPETSAFIAFPVIEP